MNLNEFITTTQADTPAAVELPKQFKKEGFANIEVHKALKGFFNKANPGNEEPYSFTHIGGCFLELGYRKMHEATTFINTLRNTLQLLSFHLKETFVCAVLPSPI
jgi:hypothetical protein